MTRPEEFTVVDPDGETSVAYRWSPLRPPIAAVHIMHGFAEHAQRYDRVAGRLTEADYVVYADDHRGHGLTGARLGTLGDLGPRGMEGVVDAVHAVTEHIQRERPDLRVFALGHSWGSFILSRYIQLHGDDLAGALFTGTTLDVPGADRLAGFNDRFEPARTPYDWLTRDEAEVDAYLADPFCGFERVPLQPPRETDPNDLTPTGDETTIPRALPVFVFNGADDPIGGAEGGRALAEHFRALGLTDVTFRAYSGARHELFNELCRDEVTADVIAWLDDHVVR